MRDSDVIKPQISSKHVWEGRRNGFFAVSSGVGWYISSLAIVPTLCCEVGSVALQMVSLPHMQEWVGYFSLNVLVTALGTQGMEWGPASKF